MIVVLLFMNICKLIVLNSLFTINIFIAGYMIKMWIKALVVPLWPSLIYPKWGLLIVMWLLGDWDSPPRMCLNMKANSRLSPSQWETLLQSNTVSHWLGENLESALNMLLLNLKLLCILVVNYDKIRKLKIPVLWRFCLVSRFSRLLSYVYGVVWSFQAILSFIVHCHICEMNDLMWLFRLVYIIKLITMKCKETLPL